MWKQREQEIKLYRLEDKINKVLENYVNHHYLQDHSINFLSPQEIKHCIKNKVIGLTDKELLKYEKMIEQPKEIFNELSTNIQDYE